MAMPDATRPAGKVSRISSKKTRVWSSLEPENDVAIKGALWKWNDISPDLTNKHVRRKRSSLGDHPWYVLPTVFFCCLSAQTSLKIERNRVSYSRKKSPFLDLKKMVHILVKKTFTKHHGTHEKTRVKTPGQAYWVRKSLDSDPDSF